MRAAANNVPADPDARRAWCAWPAGERNSFARTSWLTPKKATAILHTVVGHYRGAPISDGKMVWIKHRATPQPPCSGQKLARKRSARVSALRSLKVG